MRKHGFPVLPFFLIGFAAACLAAWLVKGLDPDSYYMIAQGRAFTETDTLTDAFTATYYPDIRLPIQQWAWCRIEYAADRTHTLPLLFCGLCLLLLAMFRLYLYPEVKDPFWGWLIAAVCTVVLNAGYFLTLRPENLTLILLLMQMVTLETYQKYDNPLLLIFPFIATVSEMCFHASMWPFHFCVWAAYLIRIPAGRNRNARLRLTPPVLIAFLATVLALFTDPYDGPKLLTYPFLGLRVFNAAMPGEQDPMALASADAVIAALIATLAVFLWHKRAIRSTSLNLTAGFLVLAALKSHCTMFLPLAFASLVKDAAALAPDMPSVRASMGKQAAPLAVSVCAAACLLLVPASYTVSSRGGVTASRYDALADYIDENFDGTPNVLVVDTAACVLEYRDAAKVLTDTRWEMMEPGLNGGTDMLTDFTNLAYGAQDFDPENYLRKYDIRAVAWPEDNIPFPYTAGWLDGSPDWTRASVPGFAVWVRNES